MAIKVSNGSETYEVDEKNLESAKKDGFVPTIKVSNGKVEHDVHPSKLSFAEKDGFKPLAAPRKAEALIEGFGESATLGYLNNIQAATEKPVFKILNMVTGQEVEPDDYLKARDYYNKRQDNLQNENPKSFGAGQVAGAIASSIPVAKAAQGATMAARAFNAAKAGAAYGGLQNTSETEGVQGGLDAKERFYNALTGAATGAGASLGADSLVKGASKIAQGASNLKNKVGTSFKKTAEKLAENATGATRVQAEKYSDDAGRYLLDEGIVGFGDDAEKIAEKANARIKKSEQQIDSSLKALDAKGVKVSQDDIVSKLQTKIKDLEKDSSQADVVRKLKTIVDDIIQTGESELSASNAEQVKRGFNKMAKNWQDPEKGQAGKIAYRAYRDSVEDAAKASDPAIAQAFKEGKNTFGKLNPIADAAEKRAKQLNQNPIGGLLDTAAVIGGSVGNDDPITGGAMGIAAALARRKLAPKAGSSLAVAFDKMSKQLLKNPKTLQLAQKSPEKFTNLVYSYLKPSAGSFNEGLPQVADSPKKGYEKWVNDGASKLEQSGLESDQIEKLKKSKSGRDLLIEASDAKPNSKRMDGVLRRIRTGELKEAN